MSNTGPTGLRSNASKATFLSAGSRGEFVSLPLQLLYSLVPGPSLHLQSQQQQWSLSHGLFSLSYHLRAPVITFR